MCPPLLLRERGAALAGLHYAIAIPLLGLDQGPAGVLVVHYRGDDAPTTPDLADRLETRVLSAARRAAALRARAL